MSLFQHALQLPHLLPWSGAGHVLFLSSSVTPDSNGHALEAGPSIFDLDRRIIKFSGTTSGSINVRYFRSCVGSQCLVPGVCLHTSKIFFRCSTLCMSPESCHLKYLCFLISVTIAVTHCGELRLSSLRCNACLTLLNLYRPRFRA